MTKKIAIVDFGDTLFITRHTVEKAAKILLNLELTLEDIRKLPKEQEYHVYEYAFRRLYRESKPNTIMVNKINELKRDGYEIIVLTARRSRNRKYTEDLLKRYKIPYDLLVMKEETNENDEKWKLGFIKKLISDEKIDNLLIFDDKESNIKYFKENIKNTNNIRFYLVYPDKIIEI